jgi:hypothetical protein
MLSSPKRLTVAATANDGGETPGSERCILVRSEREEGGAPTSPQGQALSAPATREVQANALGELHCPAQRLRVEEGMRAS